MNSGIDTGQLSGPVLINGEDGAGAVVTRIHQLASC
jgi:hypothetical protein